MRSHTLKKLIELHHPMPKRVILDWRTGRQVLRLNPPEENVFRDVRFFQQKPTLRVKNAPPDVALSPLQAAHDLLVKGNALIPGDHARYVDENNPDAGVVICDESGSPGMIMPTDVYDVIRKEAARAEGQYNPLRFA